MRVLFWSDFFPPYPGGAEIMGGKLLRGLSARGYDFTVVTSHHYLELPDQDDYYGIPVYRFPFRSALTRGVIPEVMRLRREIAQIKERWLPQLIHLNAVGPSAIFNLSSGADHQAPLLITLHTLYGQLAHASGAGSDTLLKRSLASAAWVTCVSEAVLADARKQAPEITALSSVIYNGLDEPRIAPRPLPFSPPRLLCLGRFIPAKGFDLALQAVSHLVREFPDLEVVIAGDGPERASLQAQAMQLGLEHSIEFTGWLTPDEVPDLINTATLLLMPSRREGLPLVAIEAAQMGRPVVATRIGGLPEIIVPEQTGKLVEPEDVEGLTAALASILRDSDNARRMGEAARRRAKEHFALERCIGGYDALYRCVAN
jgi:glycogen(starch) synthase